MKAAVWILKYMNNSLVSRQDPVTNLFDGSWVEASICCAFNFCFNSYFLPSFFFCASHTAHLVPVPRLKPKLNNSERENISPGFFFQIFLLKYFYSWPPSDAKTWAGFSCKFSREEERGRVFFRNWRGQLPASVELKDKNKKKAHNRPLRCVKVSPTVTKLSEIYFLP